MLKDRNFAVATLGCFSSACTVCQPQVLIPQFLQENDGYTQNCGAGAVSGRAVIMFMMPVVGFWLSRVNTKILIAFGCTISALSLFVMAGWTLQID